MAQLYALEPQPNAKVLLKTSFGDLEVELWGKETPLTTRNFLQLCYDGYYNDTSFHRLVPGFILQGGDPSGSGHGGEAIYDGGLFADEFHPRLRFNRRGLLGMANTGRRDDNGSQFFFTLGDTKELTGRNTMFGKIEGNTIYNLVRMGEQEVMEGTERPLYPLKITATEVLVNPFEDVKPRETKRKAEVGEKKKVGGKKKKGGKQLLSFGGDEEEGGAEIVMPVRKKPKFNSKLVATKEEEAPAAKSKKVEKKSIPEQRPDTASRSASPPKSPPARSRRKSKSASPARSRSPSPDKATYKLQKTEAQIAALKASLRRGRSPEDKPSEKKEKKSLLDLQKSMLPATSIQGRKRKRKADKTETEADSESWEAVLRFRSRLQSAPSPPPEEPKSPELVDANGEKGGDEGDGEDAETKYCDLHFIPNCQSCLAWDVAEEEAEDRVGPELWGHKLSFEKDRLGKDLNWRKKNEELVVIDPREREKEFKGNQKEKGSGKGKRTVGKLSR